MDFLDKIILDNTIRSYCIVAGTILVMLLLKRYFSRYIAAVLYRIFQNLWKGVAKQNFIDLVVEPLEWLLVLLIAVFAIDKLNFPAEWQYKIYGHAIDDILTRLGIGIIIVAFTRFLLRVIDFIALVLEQNASITPDKAHDQLVILFPRFFKSGGGHHWFTDADKSLFQSTHWQPAYQFKYCGRCCCTGCKRKPGKSHRFFHHIF
ncbi:hypothetical protein [Ferruginibacter sp.]